MNGYSVIYDDGRYIVIHYNGTNQYSFGYHWDLRSFYGFPVNQSCVTADEAVSLLKLWIEIDHGFILLIDRWTSMIDAIRKHEEETRYVES